MQNFDLVSPETAEELKGLGFAEPVENYFDRYHQSGSCTLTSSFFPNEIRRPTTTQVQTWLRKFFIFVSISHIPFNQKFSFKITGKFQEGDQGVLKAYNFKAYESHEEALFVGIEEGIKLLKTK